MEKDRYLCNVIELVRQYKYGGCARTSSSAWMLFFCTCEIQRNQKHYLSIAIVYLPAYCWDLRKAPQLSLSSKIVSCVITAHALAICPWCVCRVGLEFLIVSLTSYHLKFCLSPINNNHLITSYSLFFLLLILSLLSLIISFLRKLPFESVEPEEARWVSLSCRMSVQIFKRLWYSRSVVSGHSRFNLSHRFNQLIIGVT